MAMDRLPMGREEVIRWFAAKHDYLDKEIRRPMEHDQRDDSPTPVEKIIIVEHLIADRVRLVDGDDEVGRIVNVSTGPKGSAYTVSWPKCREVTDHWDFELEPAD